MTRITIAMLKKAFAKTKLAPIQHGWRDGGGACALTALALARGMPAKAVPSDRCSSGGGAKKLRRWLPVSVEYATDFVYGWDCTWVTAGRQGVVDGQAAWKALRRLSTYEGGKK